MGIILSAMAAAGDAGVKSIDQNIEQQNKLEQQNNLAQLALKGPPRLLRAARDWQRAW